MSQDEWDIDISPKDVDEFLKKYGWKRSQMIFSVLGKHLGTYEAIRSKEGQALLKDLQELITYNFGKIATNEASDEEKMEYSICIKLYERFAKTIAIVQTNAKKLKE